MGSNENENNMNVMNQEEIEDDEDSEQNYQRTLEDITTVLKYAKVDKNNLTDVAQALYFPELSPDLENFYLIELGPDLLKVVENGDPMQIKGGLNEKAVLCTHDKTFDLKAAEISNSLLLTPDLKLAQATSSSPIKSPQNAANRSLDKSIGDDEEEDQTEEMGSQVIPFKEIEMKVVTKVYHEYFECTQIKPRFRKAVDLLNLTLYSGPENEYKIQRKLLFTYNKLLDTAQCSEKEFLEGLNQVRALNIDGHIRKLDDGYEYHCVKLMLNLIEENSWELNEIDENITINLLKEIVPEEVLSGLCDLYTENSDIPRKSRYKEEMVSRIILTNILLPDLQFNYNEFMQTWKQDMPEGMNLEVSKNSLIQYNSIQYNLFLGKPLKRHRSN